MGDFRHHSHGDFCTYLESVPKIVDDGKIAVGTFTMKKMEPQRGIVTFRILVPGQVASMATKSVACDPWHPTISLDGCLR